MARRPISPAMPLERVNRFFRRRLNDSIESLFEEACVATKLSAAADLLSLLERWHTPRQAGAGGERRTSDATVHRMHHKLRRLATLSGLPVASLGTYPKRERGNDGEPTPPISKPYFFGSGETRDGLSDRSADVINRLGAELRSKKGKHQIALVRIAELEAVLRFPMVRKALLRALHPDTHPDTSDRERREMTVQFQKTLTLLNSLRTRPGVDDHQTSAM
jgi:hypothetical protein